MTVVRAFLSVILLPAAFLLLSFGCLSFASYDDDILESQICHEIQAEYFRSLKLAHCLSGRFEISQVYQKARDFNYYGKLNPRRASSRFFCSGTVYEDAGDIHIDTCKLAHQPVEN